MVRMLRSEGAVGDVRKWSEVGAKGVGLSGQRRQYIMSCCDQRQMMLDTSCDCIMAAVQWQTLA